MINRSCLFGMAVSLIGLCLAGCESDGTPVYRASSSNSNRLPAAVLSNYYVNLDQPSVTIEDGNTVITGAVRRKPGVRWLLVGRVDIEFVAANGQVIDELPALITPKTISMDPNAASVYSTSYGYTPPAGSTVRIHYVDSDTEAREDLEGFEPDAGGGAAVGGLVTGNHAPAAKKGGYDHFGRGGFGTGFGFH